LLSPPSPVLVMDPRAEARIRELRRRMGPSATSPLFFGLAEEYRAAGRLPEAIVALEKGLAAHQGYVGARVLLARAYLEAGRADDAAQMFTSALALDPANMVSARSLAEIHLSRGEKVEAIRKYKLYHDLSGDRAVEEIIAKLEKEVGSPPPPAAEVEGRVLADLYFEQGHFAEALTAYEGLWRADPSDAELERRRSEAGERLAAVGPPTVSGEPEAARTARIQALKRWLSVIQKR
jgi:tetratricopeptide (TPR) repeat protein